MIKYHQTRAINIVFIIKKPIYLKKLIEINWDNLMRELFLQKFLFKAEMNFPK